MSKTSTLAGLRVLDLSSRASAAWCSRLLGDFGAQVLLAEQPEGHPLRHLPPFDDEGVSVSARYLLANKSSVAAADAPGLIERADVIVTDALPGDTWDYPSLARCNPGAVVCAITPYGQTGSRSRLPGNDLTVNALSGWASVNGLAGRTPLKASGHQAAYQAGTLAFGCITAALIEQAAERKETNQVSPGQLIDVAELEVLVSTFAPAPLRYQYSGFVWPRKQSRDVNDGPVPVADGFFALTISRPAFWIKAMGILGLPDLAQDKELQQAGLRPGLKDRFADRLSAALAGWERMALFDALGRERVIAGPVLHMDELAENPQLLARDFFRQSPGGVTFPGPFARMEASDWQLRKEVGEIAGAPAAFSAGGLPASQPVRALRGGKEVGPLAGFRGLVLTQAWAGTYATELLALLGAQVIQLEVRGRLDSWRGTYQNPIPKRLRQVESATHAWNCSPLYNSVNLNKQCITVDLNTAEGIELFRGLVGQADFVSENFSPRVMGKLGLSYDELRELKPDLVMASLSAYGAVGPWSSVPGIGGTIEPSSGMSALLGYPGEDPLNSGQMYPDPVAGLCGFSAIALALLHRDLTGEGQFIDLSMQEANFTFIGDAWLEFARNGTVRGPLGNTHPRYAPHGIYPASPASPADGDDQWLAIAVETDDQWQTLAGVLELDAGLGASAIQRKQAESEIDRQVAAATRGHNKHELAADLTALGVPAAAVLDAAEVAMDTPLRERGHMVKVTHPEVGEMWQSGVPAAFSRYPELPVRPAPLQGEHSLRVFSRLLGMDTSTYSRLVDLQVTGEGPASDSTVENQA